MTENLGKSVETLDGQLHILTDINLSIAEGESLAIIGSSGSGKSTLLGLLAGLDIPSTGRVELAGTSLNNLDEDGRAGLRAKYAGFVFQSFQLLASLNALENVMLPLELSGHKQPRQEAQTMLARVGLQHRLRHYPNQLSGGEQQRVALARAFITQPKILFADEPTGNLDSNTGTHIIDLLFNLNQERGTTLVLVTHDPALANCCTRQIKLEGGSIISQQSSHNGQSVPEI